MFVKAYYRVSPFGIPTYTLFNTEKGVLQGVPEDLFKIEIGKEQYAQGNYVHVAGHTNSLKLYELLLEDRNSLAIIDYNNIGYINCHKDYYTVVLFASGSTILYTPLDKGLFGDDLVIAGIYKYKIPTLSVTPTFTLLYYSPKHDKVFTDNGLVSLGNFPRLKEDLSVKGLMSNYLGGCVLVDDADGKTIVNGEHFNFKVTDKINLIEEG